MKHPTPYQAMAISLRRDDAVIVISEPPPSIPRATFAQQVRDLFGAGVAEIGYFRLPTGIDGWLEDVVLRVRLSGPHRVRVVSGETLEGWDVPTELADRLRLLHGMIYGTMDGFWLDDVEAAPRSPPITELRIPPSQLNRWLADTAPEWRSLAPSGEAISTARLKTATLAGAYTRDDGLVAFVAPQRARLEDLEVPFRRFAVASDLLVGAARKGNGGPLVLIGRARRLPLSMLPPLRFETFSGLARSRGEALAQSYERRRIFAGKIERGTYRDWDWAPILLSAQLDDSEFGILLNQADQLLKSWSQHGDVRYYQFNYPEPSSYPFGEVAASDYCARRYGTSSLLFNWNTEDFGTIVQFPDVETLSVDRTGALPVLYVPAEVLTAPLVDPMFTPDSEPDGEQAPVEQLSPAVARRQEAEARRDAGQQAVRARDQFAALGDPTLVRVVQNVLLAQAVRSFLTISGPAADPRVARSDRTAAAIQEQARIWLGRVIRGEGNIAPRLRAEILTLLRSRPPEQLAGIMASPQRAEQMAVRERRRVDRLQADLRATAAEATADSGERQRLRNELDRMIRQETDLVNRQQPAACRQIGGTYRTNVSPPICSYPSTVSSDNAFSRVVSRIATLQGQMDRQTGQIRRVDRAVQQQLEAAQEAVRRQVERYAATIDTLNRIGEAGSALRDYSGSADLDAILGRALEVAGASPAEGSIRTPSVVLSQNQLVPESIGGHNIELMPPRGRVATSVVRPRRVRGNSTIEAEAPPGQADRIPELIRGERSNVSTAMQPTPIEPRRGTLLDEMRQVARTGGAAQPAVAQEARAAAAGCQCDILIRELRRRLDRNGSKRTAAKCPIRADEKRLDRCTGRTAAARPRRVRQFLPHDRRRHFRYDRQDGSRRRPLRRLGTQSGRLFRG